MQNGYAGQDFIIFRLRVNQIPHLEVYFAAENTIFSFRYPFARISYYDFRLNLLWEAFGTGMVDGCV